MSGRGWSSLGATSAGESGLDLIAETARPCLREPHRLELRVGIERDAGNRALSSIDEEEPGGHSLHAACSRITNQPCAAELASGRVRARYLALSPYVFALLRIARTCFSLKFVRRESLVRPMPGSRSRNMKTSRTCSSE
jgi:hypothetical protein